MAGDQYLVGDIGGTNIRLCIFHTDPRHRENEKVFREDPATRKSFLVDEALKQYRAQLHGNIRAVCLGVAGPVRGNEVKITNRPDLIRATDVGAILGIDPKKVRLVNDMPPHIASVDRLEPAELIEIKPGAHDPTGTRAVIMPGTGLGEGFAVHVPGHGYEPYPSEGGHIDFGPRDDAQDRLLRSMRKLTATEGYRTVCSEELLSGIGLRRILACLKNPDAPTFDGIPEAKDITSVVSDPSAPADDLRRKAIEIFLAILGAAAGNLAFKFAASGGVYLGGNISLVLRKQLASPAMLNAFNTSGPAKMQSLLDNTPIRLIDYKESGLLGAGVLAMRMG